MFTEILQMVEPKWKLWTNIYFNIFLTCNHNKISVFLAEQWTVTLLIHLNLSLEVQIAKLTFRFLHVLLIFILIFAFVSVLLFYFVSRILSCGFCLSNHGYP